MIYVVMRLVLRDRYSQYSQKSDNFLCAEGPDRT